MKPDMERNDVPRKTLSNAAVARLLNFAASAQPAQPEERWALIILSGELAGTQIELPRQGIARAGRATDSWIYFKNESALSVSKHHAEFTIDDEGVSVRDAGSQNGTFVNGIPCKTIMRLSQGDQIELGNCVKLMLIKSGR